MNSPSNPSSNGSLDRETIARLRTLAQETDPTLFAEIMNTYLGDLGKYYGAIHQALAQNDAAMVERNAHAMKGASMNTGALALGQLSAHIEEAAEAGNLAAVPPMLAEVEGEIRRVQADIALELSAMA
ncbi:MAG TPA: Hpt domain-containing protein [Candidatus Saccharimonadia bacterium]|nr:Hpt domain-containing protein [Candidatus Saccharimonadia bacterium]